MEAGSEHRRLEPGSAEQELGLSVSVAPGCERLRQPGEEGVLLESGGGMSSRNRRGWRTAVLGAAFCVGSGAAAVNSSLWAQAIPGGTPASIPAGSRVTGGGTPGQSGLTPNSPASVPQASTAVTPGPQGAQEAQQAALGPTMPALANGLAEFRGLQVQAIQFEGVDFDANDRLLGQLGQKTGEPLDPVKVRDTTRRLFATGRYRNIGVRVVRSGNAVTLVFTGVARYYIGRVQIDGVNDGRLASLLEYGTQLNPGTPFSSSQIPAATLLVKQTLAQNGYYQPVVSVVTQLDTANDQVNVTYTVGIGPLARVGDVQVTGTDPGISLAKFRKKAKLKRKSKVSRETTSTALSDLRAVYQKENRLEATVTLQKSTYDSATKTLNYQFQAEQGPIVKVVVEGAKISKSRLHLLVPVFEEGAIDNDLLNEGLFKIRDFMQQSGFFDAKVSFKVIGEDTPRETVLYIVDRGQKHKVASVEIKGNKYFATDDLLSRLQTQRSTLYLRAGRYSEQVMKADVSNVQALYRANGFSNAKVTSTTRDVSTAKGKDLKVAEISVIFTIDEGAQQQFGTVAVKGADATKQQALLALTNTREGQPFSLATLSGDRDALLGYYLSNGFDQARIEVKQTVESADKTRTDIAFDVTEGQQVTIRKVLESGIHYTRPEVVNDQVTVHAGDPLDQSALLDTQRRLYNLALFNEVVAAVQNPAGQAQEKNVLLQITEGKRWDVTYGFGFEAQTGTPGRGLYQTTQGNTAAQNGKAGVSPRVSLDVSRINLRGTDDSLTLHTSYGLLEEVATLSFQNPHLLGNPKFALQVSGGYTNVQDITTFAAKTLQGNLRVTQKPSKKDTFIYDFIYRRVQVDPNSLAISLNLIPLLSQPVRVGGPQVTWFHDTRNPSPLDATKGSYTSAEEFYSSSKVGSQVDFNRTDLSNSTYYRFGKRAEYTLARNTRFGFINSYGANPNVGNASCVGDLLTTNASCNPVPLPERLYAGGATSHRGFGINDAGPRDLQTGYPVGGSTVFVNSTELRLPPPTLPYVGASIAFVVFHDMGNVFQHPSDTFSSFLRFHQPNSQTCSVVTGVQIGSCDFRYFSHALGLGARYKTPVGPIRLDLSYNLNPTVYPVITGVANAPFVGNTGHFNFFFSIGQSF